MKKISFFRNADKKTKIWLAVLVGVCAVCILSWWLIGSLSAGCVAVVRVDGEEVYRVDLSAVRESYDVDFDTQYGHNTVHVAHNAISVSEADCPDGICVAQGAITGSGVPIVCMPHHLSVRIEGSDIDA